MNTETETKTETAREKFSRLYTESLTEAVTKYPELYCWPVENVPKVAAKMLAAIDAGAFNHDSMAFKILAKKLGIKPTRTALLSFWNSTVTP